jgi:formylglycine-generating enzyme required for sulfatase activity
MLGSVCEIIFQKGKTVKRISVWAGALTIAVALLNGSAQAQTKSPDFNMDGVVNFNDFFLFVAAFGSKAPADLARFDLSDNGLVDFDDFSLFAADFGKTVPPVGTLTVDLPGGATMDFVYIRPGKFIMGSPFTEVGRENDEGPQREVTISRGFYLGKYELTQGQWQAVMGTTPWDGSISPRISVYLGYPAVIFVQRDADNPAVYVSWDDAQALIARLNAAAGDSLYRLPTEAEWEYACRAGTTTRWSSGNDESPLKDYAWYSASILPNEWYAHRVGTKKANPWGLYDMHGNVWEWVQDRYGAFPSNPQTDPLGPASGPSRVGRGGDFSRSASYTRSAYRVSYSPSSRYPNLGLRLLRRYAP